MPYSSEDREVTYCLVCSSDPKRNPSRAITFILLSSKKAEADYFCFSLCTLIGLTTPERACYTMKDSPMSIIGASKLITSYKCYPSLFISHHFASISFNGCVRGARSINNITGMRCRDSARAITCNVIICDIT